MAGYIGKEMNRVYHNNWWQEVLTSLSAQRDLPDNGTYAELVDSLDIANCLRLIDRQWGNVFRLKLSIDFRTWSKELMGVRNDASHIGQQDFEDRYAERALDTMALLSEGFEDPECTEQIRALYRQLRYGSADGSTTATTTTPAQSKSAKTSDGVLQISVGQNLPSWRTVMQPHPDVAEGRYRAAEFAADLAQVARGEGAYEYRDPVEFFARTYVTEGMAGLLVESLQRLAGKGGEPVIQLKTAFGGGKTHHRADDANVHREADDLFALAAHDDFGDVALADQFLDLIDYVLDIHSKLLSVSEGKARGNKPVWLIFYTHIDDITRN